MTQALLQNPNIFKSKSFGVDRQSALSKNVLSDSSVSKFKTVIHKTSKKQNTSIGSTANINTDNGTPAESFKKFLDEASKEASAEKSLDLTFEKNINEETDEKINTTAEQICDTFENEICIEDESLQFYSNIASEEISETSFRQLASLAINDSGNNTDSSNNNSDYNDTCNDTDSTKTTDIEDTTKESNTIFKAKTSITSDFSKDIDHSESDIDWNMLDELNIESISSETSDSENNPMANQESPEEIGVKLMLNNSGKLETNFGTTLNTAITKPAELSAEKIIEQLTKHFDNLKSNAKINIALNPDSLGKVDLQIINTKEGLSAQFTVTTNEARELLMKGLDGLRESLLAHGVGVDNISVKVSEAEETSYNPDWLEQENSEGGNKESEKHNREEKEKGLFEKTISESLKKENGNV